MPVSGDVASVLFSPLDGRSTRTRTLERHQVRATGLQPGQITRNLMDQSELSEIGFVSLFLVVERNAGRWVPPP